MRVRGTRLWSAAFVTFALAVGTAVVVGVPVSAQATAALPPVIPAPASMTPVAGQFTVDATTRILVSDGSPGAGANPTAGYTEDVSGVAAQLTGILRPSTGLPLPVATGSCPAGPIGPADDEICLVLDTSEASHAEHYSLQSGLGRIVITSGTAEGLADGVETLAQLLPGAVESSTVQPGPWVVPGVSIQDQPRFEVRSLMLDVSRHFQPVWAVEKYIRDMAMYKFNVLHLHLMDDEGDRLAVPGYPALTQIGAESSKEFDLGPPQYYTPAQYTEIVNYASAHGVMVIPEIEGPGHSKALTLAYPGTECDTFGASPFTQGGPHTVCDNAETYQVLGAVITELAQLTPGPYIHIGGDEASLPYFNSYIAKIQAIVQQDGKHLIMWSDADSLYGSLTSDSVIEDWTSSVTSSLAGSHPVIEAPDPRYYLDNSTSLSQTYDWDPGAAGPSDVIGVDAPNWAESVATIDEAEYRTFPRALAIAEVAWTPHAEQDFGSFTARAAGQAARFYAAGIDFDPSTEVPWTVGLQPDQPTLTAAGTVQGPVAAIVAPDQQPNAFSATVSWDGGPSEPAIIINAPGSESTLDSITDMAKTDEVNGVYQVISTHLFADPSGAHTATVTVTEPGGATTAITVALGNAGTPGQFAPTLTGAVLGTMTPTTVVDDVGTAAGNPSLQNPQECVYLYAADATTTNPSQAAYGPQCSPIADGSSSQWVIPGVAPGSYKVAYFDPRDARTIWSGPAGTFAAATTITVSAGVTTKTSFSIPPVVLDQWELSSWPANTDLPGQVLAAEDTGADDYLDSVYGSYDTSLGKGDAATFDGAPGEGITNQAPPVDGSWTVSAWVEPTATNSASMVLIGGSTMALKVRQFDTGQVGFSTYGSSDTSFGYRLPLNTWTFLTFVYDPGGTPSHSDCGICEPTPIEGSLTLYANGAEVDSKTVGTDYNLDRTDIGTTPGDPTSEQRIKDVSVDGSAMTSSQVAGSYSGGSINATPSVSPTPNAAGWTDAATTTVTWHWQVTGPLTANGANCPMTTVVRAPFDGDVSATCTDATGVTASWSQRARLDDVAPTASPSVSPTASAAGWSRGPVTVSWHWADPSPGSGLTATTASNCPASTTVSTLGKHTVSASCTDAAGNTGTAAQVVWIDSTGPTGTSVQSPSANVSGWTRPDADGNVTLSWTWDDGTGSGLTTSTATNCPATTVLRLPQRMIAQSGTQGANVTCTDAAGNTTKLNPTVKIDAYAPTDQPVISPAPNNLGWVTAPGSVSVGWRWTDELSGSGKDTSNSGCTTSTPVTGTGVQTVGSACSDLAGNAASDAVTVRVDSTPPAANPTVSNGVVLWNWVDPESGYASCPPAGAIPAPGQSVQATCTNNAGLTGTATYTAAPAGTVTGTVTDAQTGDPLAAVCVRITPNSGSSPAHETCTDASGNYTLTGLAAGDYTVAFTDIFADHLSQTLPATVTSAATTTVNAALALVPTGNLTGTVTDQAGNPIPNLCVWIERAATPMQPYLRACTGTDGVYLFTGLAPGQYAVWFGVGEPVPNYAPQWYQNATTPDEIAAHRPTVAAGNITTTGIDAVMAPATFNTISGTITDAATGAPVSGVCVNLYLYSSDVTNPTNVTTEYGGAAYQTCTGPNGHYQLSVVAEGVGYAEEVTDPQHRYPDYWNETQIGGPTTPLVMTPLNVSHGPITANLAVPD